MQATALQGVSVAITKNLFLVDKKDRLYLITALEDTTIEMLSLGMRLGVGRNAIRMAPEELLPSVLGVEPGSVTPLALANPAASKVALLLDERLRLVNAFCVHPLINTMSTVMTSTDLETFAKSLGREPCWIDFGARPILDKDNPPDLKYIADATAPSAPKEEKCTNGIQSSATMQKKKASAGTSTKAKTPQKKSTSGSVSEPVVHLSERLIERVLEACGSEILDATKRRTLISDFEMELNAFKNGAYAHGFKAAKGAAIDAIQCGK